VSFSPWAASAARGFLSRILRGLLRRAKLRRRKDIVVRQKGITKTRKTESTKAMEFASDPWFPAFRFVFSSFRVFVIFMTVLGKTVAII
jgi:hypothetical protein